MIFIFHCECVWLPRGSLEGKEEESKEGEEKHETKAEMLGMHKDSLEREREHERERAWLIEKRISGKVVTP